MYSESASHGSIEHSYKGWVVQGDGAVRKSALHDEAIDYIKNGALECNPGYGFDCFVNASGVTVDPLTWNRNSDATYYIKLKNVGTPVSFDLSGLASVDEQVVNAGEKVTKPDDPVVTGYTFKGWYKEDTYTTTWNFSTDTVGSDPVVIYGKFEENEYNVTLNINDGSYVSPYTAPTKRKYTESITLPTSANVEKTGHTFGGWYENADFSGSAITTINANTTSDKTLYAKWTANEYNVTLNLNGGSINSGNITKYTYGVGATLPNDVEGASESEQFAGWYAQSDFSGARVYTISNTDIGDKVYYAKYGRVYKVSFDPGEGEGTMATVNVEEGKSYNAPACEFTHATLVFDKWQGSDGKTYNKNASISLSSDLTLTALYKEASSNKGGSGTINTGGSGGSRGGSRTSTVNIISNTHFWEGSHNRWRGKNIYDGSYITNAWKYMNYAGSSGWYYFGNDGYILSGWQTIDGQRYYFEKDNLLTFGMMYTGEKTVDGIKCRFNDNGVFEGYMY